MSDQDTNVFETNENTSTQQAADQLIAWVGEGKKYATPEDALASVPHAQAHIQQLEQELSQVRSQIDQSSRASEILERMEKLQQTQGQAPTEASQQASEEKSGLTAEGVRKLLEERELEKSVQQNLTTANKMAVDIFGENAQEKLAQRAQALGMSIESLKEVAAKSPAAFQQLITSPTKGPGPQATVPSQETNSSQEPQAEHGTFKWFEQLRISDPKNYWSRETQAELHRQAQKLGDDFFK